MAIDNAGLNLMVDGIGQEAALYLAAYVGTVKEGTAIAVTYDAAVAGVADIATVNPTITISAGKTITKVQLQDTIASTTDAIATSTISAYFPDGGDLIIESYEMTVTST